MSRWGDAGVRRAGPGRRTLVGGVTEALGIDVTEDGGARDEQAYLLLIEGGPPSGDVPSWWTARLRGGASRGDARG